MEKLNPLFESLGIEAEVVKKIEAGEIDAKEYAKEFHSKYETTIKSRTAKEIEEKVTPEAFGKAYGKIESMLSAEFGLTMDEFNDIPKNERTAKMIAKIKEIQQKEKESFGNIDQKTKQLDEQLKEANRLLKLKEKEIEEKLNAVHTEYRAKETRAMYENQLTKLIASVQNPAYDAETMEAVFYKRMFGAGYDYEAEAGKIWLLKDGKRVPNPTRPTENLDVDAFFQIVANEKQFTKLSNGGESKKFTLDNPEMMSKIHPNRLKQIEAERMGK
jgi:hypothetical protein